MMMNGRPADYHFMTGFFEPGEKRRLDKSKELMNVQGMQYFSTMMKGVRANG
jgi:hypothetical protein